jgi:hypothetical protein
MNADTTQINADTTRLPAGRQGLTRISTRINAGKIRKSKFKRQNLSFNLLLKTINEILCLMAGAVFLTSHFLPLTSIVL